MKILILNQAFYPDVVSTAQHATDLALELTKAGHEVSVIASRRAYDNPSSLFSRRETWKGITIRRVGSTGFGKDGKWRRIIDVSTYLLTCCARMLLSSRVDVIVSLTSPPLISYIAALAVPLKAKRMVFWSMDVNPDEAIAAGWLRKESFTARFLSRLLLRSLEKADRIIALDRFMKKQIQAKGIAEEKIVVIPPWSHDDYVHFDPLGREQFGHRYGLTNKFVVMYSGNHSPCHPLDTLLQAAEQLAGREDIVFCFVGGGTEFRKLRAMVGTNGLRNVLCVPYQPLDLLSGSLSAADLHVVLMGDPFVGIIHPCKIYNILAVRRPFLYIGPKESHIGDILARESGLGYALRHGQVDQVVAAILTAFSQRDAAGSGGMAERFSRRTLIPQMVYAIEEAVAESPARKKPQPEEPLAGQERPEAELLG